MNRRIRRKHEKGARAGLYVRGRWRKWPLFYFVTPPPIPSFDGLIEELRGYGIKRGGLVTAGELGTIPGPQIVRLSDE